MSPTEEAWNTAYAAYGEELAAFVRGRVDGENADDLLQDIWAALSETLSERAVEQPRAWLYRVARNRITDHYRRHAARPSFTDLTPELPAEADNYVTSDGGDAGAWEAIGEALAHLPANQREVFERNELEGETLREIAADLGVPLKTVISRKGYARRKLRDLLRDLYEDYFGPE